MRTQRSGFTLIELLIVVAIIAILALIAVPNFLEAQIRAKVSRSKADMRTLATGIEAYYTDANDYPRNSRTRGWTVSPDLTSPIAYLSTADLVDPFAYYKVETASAGSSVIFYPYYSYHRVLREEDIIPVKPGLPSLPQEYRPPTESIDARLGSGNPGVLYRYGAWRLLSNGPDREYVPAGWEDIYRQSPALVFEMIETLYDPTNGSVSAGNIVRTQLSADGVPRAMQ